MKRRIIIITYPGVKGEEHYSEGVYKDRSNYIDFFKEGYGGFYSDSEIRFFDTQKKPIIRRELSLLKDDDIEFSIIIFCGHGYYSKKSDSNIFQINDTEEMDSLEFRSGTKKCIVIEDNCREPLSEYVTEHLVKAFNYKALFDSISPQIDPELCKRYYNKRISECPDQIICGQACDIGEFAGDSSSRGGYYSSSLINQTVKTVEEDLRTIDLKNKYKIFSFPKCHDLAIPKVRSLSGNTQNPQIEKMRNLTSKQYLPFAIIA
jgi:hypothetical protein